MNSPPIQQQPQGFQQQRWARNALSKMAPSFAFCLQFIPLFLNFLLKISDAAWQS